MIRMLKIVFSSIAISVAAAFMASCEGSQTEEDFFTETAALASIYAVNNKTFDLNSFLMGTWIGSCYDDPIAKKLVVFSDDGRVRFQTVTSDPEIGGYEQGLFEIVDESTVRFHRVVSADLVKIRKGYNSFVFEGEIVPALSECEFSRSM